MTKKKKKNHVKNIIFNKSRYIIHFSNPRLYLNQQGRHYIELGEKNKTNKQTIEILFPFSWHSFYELKYYDRNNLKLKIIQSFSKC